MSAPAHRALALVAVATLAGAATQAQARPHRVRSVAVKAGPGRGWVPPGLVKASRAPLLGAIGAPGGSTGTPAPAAPPVIGPAAPAIDPNMPFTPAPVTAVGVTVKDTPSYLAQLSRASVPAGTVTVQLQNRGEDPHNLRIVPTDHDGPAVDLPLTDPDATATQAVTLTPGHYFLFCTLTVPVNHSAAGMNATLTVTAAP
jgi:plastocyanin